MNRLLILFSSLLIHLLIAWLLPLSNDEVYYWDWGHALHLSYKDHPPGISWMTFLSQGFSGIWQVRAMAPFLHTIALYFSLKTMQVIMNDCTSNLQKKGELTLFLIMLASPGLFFIGSISIPDIGLLCFFQVALFLMIKWAKEQRLFIYQGLILGAVLGLSGLFKYHALPLAVGSLLGFFYVRKSSLRADLGFYFALIMTGFFVCMPVWIWNYQHDFASIRYQTEHGFGAGRWSLQYPLQGFLGMALMLSPALIGMSFHVGKAYLNTAKWKKNSTQTIVLPGCFLLLLLVFFAALRKPILPHWTLPAFWLLLPLIASQLVRDDSRFRRILRYHYIYGAVISLVVLALSMGLKTRSHWLSWFDGDPLFLSELTVWEPLATEVQAQRDSWQKGLDAHGTDCSNRAILIAGVRWYTSAQLRYYLPDQPPVALIADGNYDYYKLRDQLVLDNTCYLAVALAPGQKVSGRVLEDFGEEKRVSLTISQHEKLDWQLVLLKRKK